MRGILPFHDFPEGPDWWNEDDYKCVLSQLSKLRMNFIGLHTYPERPRTNLYASAEPATWIGLPEDVKDNGEVTHSYPSRHCTTINGAWGYASQATGSFTDGSDQLFERDDYGADYMQGMAPWPVTMEANHELFNRYGRLLKSVFSYAHGLNISTCLGTEGPLTIPQDVKSHVIELGMNPEDPKVVQQLYEGIFKRIKNTHPLDYFWLWTPEHWTWDGNTEEQTQTTFLDIQLAIRAAEKVNPSIQVATSGWVLGPQTDRTLFDRHLPKSVPFSCINRNLGNEFVEPGFQTIQNRPKWAIPWIEDDPAMNLPQLWSGRIRQDAADAASYGCDGLIGIHWRTKVIDPTLSALADAGWNQTGWNPNLGNFEKMDSYTTEGAIGGRSLAVEDLAVTQEEVHRTMRLGMKGYRLQVPNGTFTLTLKFLECEVNEPGKRIFDVFTNGDIGKRIYQLDIFAESGRNQPLEHVIEAFKVSDGIIDLTFMNHHGEASISTIEIEGQTDDINQFKGYTYMRKINCGGSAIGSYEADLIELKVRDRFLPIRDFYLDWVKIQFGPEICVEAVDLFTELDGKLPRPITWVTGPGSTIVANRASWVDVSSQYDFVDQLEGLRTRIQGAGHLERFDYWLNQFRYLRTAGQIGCTLGLYEAILKEVRHDASDEYKQDIAHERLLPLRKELITQYADLNNYLLATVSTPGELGTLANIQQQTMQQQLHKPGQELEAWIGEPLPQNALPSSVYTGKPRLIVPTIRTSLENGERFNLKLLILGQSPVELGFHWRKLGSCTTYHKVVCTHVNRGVYQVSFQPEIDQDFEYFIEAILENEEKLMFPLSAPELNQTVLVNE